MANAKVEAVGAITSPDAEGRRTGWLATASVAGAFLASSCCIVPLALVMLGVSGAWIGNLTALAPYKQWFVAGTLMLLSLGFLACLFQSQAGLRGWIALRQAAIGAGNKNRTVVCPRARSVGGHNQLLGALLLLGDSDMKSTLMILATIAALGAGGLAVVNATPAAAASDALQVTASKRTGTFAIANMTCALCPITVKTAMERVAGVKSVQVDFNSKTATVIYVTSLATAEAIAEASRNVGYPAVPVQ